MAPPPFDPYRDAFLGFVAGGMNYDEALGQFDEAEFQAAAMAEIDSHLVRKISFEESINRGGGGWVTADERGLPGLLDLLVKAEMERRNGVYGAAYTQALALWQAGWTSEDHGSGSQVMGWYWRRPPRVPGKLGRRYLSTNQAHRAMQKEIAR